MEEEDVKSRRPSLGAIFALAVAGLVVPQARADLPLGTSGRPDQVVQASAASAGAADGEESACVAASASQAIARAGLAAVILFYPPSYLTSPPGNEVTPPSPGPTTPPTGSTPPPVGSTPPPITTTPPPPPPPPPPGGGTPPPPETPPASQPEPATLISGLVGAGLVSVYGVYRRRRAARRLPPD